MSAATVGLGCVTVADSDGRPLLRTVNTQLSYMILRGAGKQYGVIWLLNGSTCSRFGNKCYNPVK